MYYGLVFTSRSYTALARSYGLRQEFITPHSPEQNGMVERLIRTLKEQCAHRHRFETLQHASRVIGDWISFLAKAFKAAAAPSASRPPRCSGRDSGCSGRFAPSRHDVDGGHTDTADIIIMHIESLDPDNDHASGLVGVLKRFEVQHLWMKRPWLLHANETLPHFDGNFTLQGLIDEVKERHPYLVELEKLANTQGTAVHEVFQGAMIGRFTVLASTSQRGRTFHCR
jgi:hypothetical protein